MIFLLIQKLEPLLEATEKNLYWHWMNKCQENKNLDTEDRVCTAYNYILRLVDIFTSYMSVYFPKWLVMVFKNTDTNSMHTLSYMYIWNIYTYAICSRYS